MKKSPKKYYGFTLVELIIVITILAILSTIAFVSFQGYTKSSRDSVRLSNLSNIEKSLEVFNVKSGTYPTPDNKINISLSGSDVSYQGTLGDKSSSILGFSKTPTDPLDNSNYFYSTNIFGKSYSLVSFVENQTSFISTKALADNSNKSTLTKGNLSYLLDANNNALTSNTDLFGNGSGSSFVQVLNNTTKLTGSGIELGGGFQMLALGNGNYSSPTSCPEGFIPVVGSADFSQPGFCVAKYEMSLKRILTSSDLNTTWNSWIGSINTKSVNNSWNEGEINSKSLNYPIANTTQIQAISACKNMGPGYHLISNNERMTIARQIENNPSNWSNGILGSGGIYRGITSENNQINSLGCKSIDSSGLHPKNDATTTLNQDTTLWGNQKTNNCDSKRQLLLNNNQIIWDFAGNLWEHVNKNNSIDGYLYNYGKSSLTINSFKSCSFDSNDNNCFDFNNSNDGSVKLNSVFSTNKTFSEVNGMGIGYGNGVNNNVFVRGGANLQSASGIYTILFNYDSSSQNTNIGFRCAYIKQ